MTTEQTSRGISRRSIAKGAAWAAPVIAVAGAAPFASASHHEPPTPVAVSGVSCKTGGNSGTIKKGFYGQFKVTNNTGAPLTYTITSFQSAAMTLTNVQVSSNPTGDNWTGAGSTFTVPNGGSTTFWIRASGDDSGNTAFTMFYTVAGFGDTYSADLTYDDMLTCCTATPTCPPYAYAGNTDVPAPESAATTQQKQQAPASSAPASAETKAPATKSATQAPATKAPATQTPASSAPAVETKAAEAPASSAPASSAATEAPASGSASK